MSAYQVDPKHIAALIGTALSFTYYMPTFVVAKVARQLTETNMKSVAALYSTPSWRSVKLDEDTVQTHMPTLHEIEAFHAQPLYGPALFKALDCYEYQSGNAPDWLTSDAARFCAQLRKAGGKKLQGYDDVEWGITQLPAKVKVMS